MLTCEKPTAPSGAQETDDSSTTHNYGAIITYKCIEENSRFGPDVTTNKQELTIACQLNTDTNVMSYQSLTDEQICVEVEDPIVTVDLDTVIESTFEIDIACDQTQEDSAKNSFSAAFAGIIQDLQNTNENYKDFSVKDVVCDASNSKYSVTVEFTNQKEEGEIASYNEKADLANQYLSVFSQYVNENSLDTQLAKDVGGTRGFY